jgi:hypothetical protein
VGKTREINQEMSPLVLRIEQAVFVLIFFGPETEQIPSAQAAVFVQMNSFFELALMPRRGSAASVPAAAVWFATAAASGQQATPVASCSASGAAGFGHWRMSVTP